MGLLQKGPFVYERAGTDVSVLCGRRMMKNYVAGVDVGGTTIKMGLFPVGKAPVELWEVKTPSREEIDRLYEVIRDALHEKLAEIGEPEKALLAIGIGLPGPVREDGYVSSCPNLGLYAEYPAARLEELMGIPVAAVNDANAAALGEVYYGAAKGTKNAIMVTLGTGVGGGVVVDGNVLAGSHGVGGELGHFIVNPAETKRCNCGNRGCLEQYASATGIVRSAKELLSGTSEPSVLRGIFDLSAKDVLDAAKAADPIALQVLESFGQYLGMAIAHLILTTDPEKIILGGGVSKAGQILVETLDKYVDDYTHIAEKRADIVLATLGNDAGMYGAASLASKLLEK